MGIEDRRYGPWIEELFARTCNDAFDVWAAQLTSQEGTAIIRSPYCAEVNAEGAARKRASQAAAPLTMSIGNADPQVGGVCRAHGKGVQRDACELYPHIAR